MIDLELLKGIEPQPKQRNSVKTEHTGDQNSEQSGSLSDIFTAKGKKSTGKSDKKIKNEQVDEFKVKNEYVQEQYENDQYYGQNEQHYGQNEHEQYYGHTEHDAYNGQNDDYYEQNGENYAENDHIAENKVRTVHISLLLAYHLALALKKEFSCNRLAEGQRYLNCHVISVVEFQIYRVQKFTYSKKILILKIQSMN